MAHVLSRISKKNFSKAVGKNHFRALKSTSKKITIKTDGLSKKEKKILPIEPSNLKSAYFFKEKNLHHRIDFFFPKDKVFNSTFFGIFLVEVMVRKVFFRFFNF